MKVEGYVAKVEILVIEGKITSNILVRFPGNPVLQSFPATRPEALKIVTDLLADNTPRPKYTLSIGE